MSGASGFPTATGTPLNPTALDTRSLTAPLVKYDLVNGSVETHDFGPGRTTGEAVFVPASATAGEDEGHVLSSVYDAARDTSYLVILAAANFTGPPVAVVNLPQRVPFGSHGSWIPGEPNPARRRDLAG